MQFILNIIKRCLYFVDLTTFYILGQNSVKCFDGFFLENLRLSKRHSEINWPLFARNALLFFFCENEFLLSLFYAVHLCRHLRLSLQKCENLITEATCFHFCILFRSDLRWFYCLYVYLSKHCFSCIANR